MGVEGEGTKEPYVGMVSRVCVCVCVCVLGRFARSYARTNVRMCCGVHAHVSFVQGCAWRKIGLYKSLPSLELCPSAMYCLNIQDCPKDIPSHGCLLP